jgi:hypothetical protein
MIAGRPVNFGLASIETIDGDVFGPESDDRFMVFSRAVGVPSGDAGIEAFIQLVFVDFTPPTPLSSDQLVHGASRLDQFLEKSFQTVACSGFQCVPVMSGLLELTSPAPVPEPMSLSLLGTGIAWLAARKVRQRLRDPGTNDDSVGRDKT